MAGMQNSQKNGRRALACINQEKRSTPAHACHSFMSFACWPFFRESLFREFVKQLQFSQKKYHSRETISILAKETHDTQTGFRTLLTRRFFHLGSTAEVQINVMQTRNDALHMTFIQSGISVDLPEQRPTRAQTLTYSLSGVKRLLAPPRLHNTRHERQRQHTTVPCFFI